MGPVSQRTESLTMPESVQKLNNIKVEGRTDFDRIEKVLKSATPADKSRLDCMLSNKIVSKHEDGPASQRQRHKNLSSFIRNIPHQRIIPAPIQPPTCRSDLALPSDNIEGRQLLFAEKRPEN